MSEMDCFQRYIREIVSLQDHINSYTNEDKLLILKDVIGRNLRGCDMILTLFITALHSHSSDERLRPFPPSFIKGGTKDFVALKNVCGEIPPLKDIIHHSSSFSKESLELLWWLFVLRGFPILECIPFSSDILPSDIPEGFKPQYMFKVHNTHKADDSFKARRVDKDLILAYHGSAVDNFYSILKVGLQQHFSLERETLYGKGVYLSSECSISANYSPYSQTWKHSSLGTTHSIVALCEVINNKEKVKCKDSKNERGSSNSNSDQIPDKYFVVIDSDMIRVKYLLVYSKNQMTSVRSFFRQYIFWILLGLYISILICVGSNRTPWKKYGKYFNDL